MTCKKELLQAAHYTFYILENLAYLVHSIRDLDFEPLIYSYYNLG